MNSVHLSEQYPCPRSRAPSSRGGAKHTRRLKSAWKRALAGNDQARAWLITNRYELPPTPAQQAQTSRQEKARRQAEAPGIRGQAAPPLSDQSVAKTLRFLALPLADSLFNDCPKCYSTVTERQDNVETDQGKQRLGYCTGCRRHFRLNPNAYPSYR